MTHPTSKSNFPVNRNAARETGFRSLRYYFIPVAVICVACYIISFLCNPTLDFLAESTDEIIIVLLYLLAYGFCVFGSIYGFTRKSTFFFGDDALWVINKNNPLTRKDHDRGSDALGTGEQKLDYADIKTVKAYSYGLTIETGSVNVLTQAGRVFIPASLDDYEQLMRRINVLGDQHLWEFPNDKRR